MMAPILHQIDAGYAFVERNWGLVKRYIGWDFVWLVYGAVTTLTIGLIGVSTAGLAGQDAVLYLLIGALLWTFLSVMFQFMSESVQWERWEGTIEYTFMAPVSRITYLVGHGVFAVSYSLIRTVIILGITVVWFHLDLSQANLGAALLVLLLASLSFLGLGLLGATLPLLSTERGAQATHIVNGVLLLCSSVYYPITVLPAWLQPLARVNPATLTLDAIRACMMRGAGLGEVWPQVWRLVVTAAVLIPLGLVAFAWGEKRAMKTGKLKRNG